MLSARASLTAVFALAAVAVSGAGCAANPRIRAAESGHYEGLREQLTADVQRGRLAPGDAVGFAKAVAAGEIERAEGPLGAQSLRDMVSCAKQVDAALDRRVGKRDALSPLAALVRVDGGAASADSWSSFAKLPPGDERAGFRALGARSLTGSGDGELRRALIADPDEDVRRSALQAALSAGDPDDLEAILEAARVDPSPEARLLAIRAAGGLGSERAVLALRDIWQRADAPVREAVVDAWTTRNAFNSGGRRELMFVVDRNKGRPAVRAAATLVKAGGEGSVEALGFLEHAVKEGPTDARTYAIELAPLSLPTLREAMRKAEGDSDEAVATAAMVRRFESGHADGPARAELGEKLLKVADNEKPGPGWLSAVGALARAHDARVLPALEREGAAKDKTARIQAGVALALLGDMPHAAIVAADAEPRVRVMVSCAMLRAWASR
jgi:hypothetical protein